MTPNEFSALDIVNAVIFAVVILIFTVIAWWSQLKYHVQLYHDIWSPLEDSKVKKEQCNEGKTNSDSVLGGCSCSNQVAEGGDKKEKANVKSKQK